MRMPATAIEACKPAAETSEIGLALVTRGRSRHNEG